jgi:hypothetical protein
VTWAKGVCIAIWILIVVVVFAELCKTMRWFA